MRKLLAVPLLGAVGIVQPAVAQTREVSGRVTDAASGQGLPGVTVIVKGTTTGASTNANGEFSLAVPAGATTLTFSSIGYLPVERAIGTSSTIDVGLSTDTKQLSEVVVTALGVERTRNSLPYAATQIENETITKARNTNVVNGLSGKVAGVQIRQSNSLGGSSNILIRGTKSVTGNNQPLFVVDGVPISNSNTNTATQRSGGGGYDYGNAAADIAPDDVASVTVLKGAAATALYGDRASNGVIMITTKKGRKGLGVTINTGLTAGKVDKSTFIKYQDRYGAGYGNYYEDPSGKFLYRDIDGDGKDDLVAPLSEDASYGAAFDPNLNVFQWDAFDPSSPNFGKARPWVAAKNGPLSFFETAVSTNNSVSIDGGNDMGTFKLGYNDIRDKGILPNSQVNKNIVNFSGSLNVSPRLTTSASVNFTRIKGLGRYGTGYSSRNLMTNFRQWWQTNVDIKDQKAAYDRNNQNVTWNWHDPDDLTAIYWDNPYFTRYQNFQNDQRNRVFGNVVATYKFADWFNLMGRVTLDSYDEMQEERQAIGSTTNDGPAFYSRYDRTFREANYDLIGNFNKNITENFSFRGLVGANLRRERSQSIRSSTNGGLVVPGLYSLSNTAQPLTPPGEVDYRRAVDGVFASTTFGFREMVFLDLTLRRDVSSTLPKENNSFYYPSAAVGFVFSELLKDTPWLSYAKARANYAEVGSGADAYNVIDVYDKPTAFGNVPLFSVPGTKNNPNLRSERTKAAEVGIEMAFFQSRLGFDATVYQSNSVDQIIPVAISTATGYNSRYVNSGDVRNRGIELTAYVTPFRTDDLNWTVNVNWTRNRNRVMSLYEGVDNVLIASYQGGVSSNATVGQPYGVLRGSNYVYDNNGNRQVTVTKNAAGIPTAAYFKQSATANEVIGDPNPDWTGGIGNTLSYKGISLYALVDIRKGGDVFSLDRFYGLATGLTPETAGNNELGNPSRNPIVRNADGSYAPNSGGVILGGTYAPGTTINGVDVSGQPNAVRTSNTNYGLYGYVRNPAAGFVYDAGFVKLREVSLSYSLPKTLLAKFGPVRGIDLSLVGRNLWIIHKNLPDADPEDALSSGNAGQGYQVGSYPNTRQIGGNIRFSF
ncbi:SusC/RagA family TonB-linked outer membrane protein [Hymenobacter latericus]|uniref:SusC/RagA family TonB-linked outer membrane protein n=1 Tax=Hymenobacter sp. YIM 151858-1 TaxID=2987688 RepID=UPI0022271D77|nr:SusC/RagA family TonB-linked outer membrane protein [Hymenobacter sp. YIM 151858-1]UYZ59230.1 SusC/RagA family TonB-linked outer membrane protein [Hymenobacter sp. YIM 151858-1]